MPEYSLPQPPDWLDVSRETLDRLSLYLRLLAKWNKAIKLVAPSTLQDPWTRHVWDSAQLLGYVPNAQARLADLGSGGGMPGLVLAICRPDLEIHLLESDQRKATFLREAARETGCQAVKIHASRIESTPPLRADIITARALAPLDKLLDLAVPHMKMTGQCLFLKGRLAREELTAAEKKWMMETEALPSKTESGAAILRLSQISKRSEP